MRDPASQDPLMILFFSSVEPVRSNGCCLPLHGDGLEPLEGEGAHALEVGAFNNEYLTRLSDTAKPGGDVDRISGESDLCLFPG